MRAKNYNTLLTKKSMSIGLGKDLQTLVGPRIQPRGFVLSEFLSVVISPLGSSAFASEKIKTGSGSNPRADFIARSAIHKIKRHSPNLGQYDCNESGSLMWNDCKPGERDYMEGRLDHVNTPVPEEYVDAKSAMPIECVKAGMIGFDKDRRLNYAACNDKENEMRLYYRDSRGKLNRTEKPCASNQMAYVVQSSFVQISDCYGIEAKKIVPLIMAESGFHINAISETNCAGPFQLCGGEATILDINERYYDEMIERFKSSNRPSCDWIANALGEQMTHRTSKSCERIAKRENGRWVYDPTRNLVYGFESFYQNLIVAKRRLALVHRFKKLSEVDQDKISTVIALWANNTGLGIVSYAQEILIQNKFTSYSNFIDQLQQKLLTEYPGDAARKKEVAGFVDLMARGQGLLNERLPQEIEKNQCGWDIR